MFRISRLLTPVLAAAVIAAMASAAQAQFFLENYDIDAVIAIDLPEEAVEVTGDDIDSIFEHADNDNDGKINQAEFTEAWNA